MTVTEAIRARRSIRRYKPDAQVTEGQLNSLLEAAMLAPSACNTRPWEFVVVRDREKLNEIMNTHQHTKMLETASLAIVVCALPGTQEADLPKGFYPQDCGAATENILLEAVELGLGCCWCGVYPKPRLIEEISKILGLGPDVIPFNIIAVGVPDETPNPRGAFDKDKVRYI